MKIDVKHTAKLANLIISEAELSKFEKQLSEVLEYIKKLDEVETKNTIPTSQVTGLENVYRQDTTIPSLPQVDALLAGKSKHNNLFKVKGLLENI